MTEIPKYLENNDKQNIVDESKEEQKKISNEKLQSLSNNDFLKIPEQNRLQYITKNKITSNDLIKKDLRVEKLEFSFTFNGKFNKELWLLTTAGQVLPQEVKTIISEGVEYDRIGSKGEFYDESGIRLKINNGTQIEITKLGTAEENEKINSAKYDEFMAKGNNSIEYNDTKFIEIINVAIEKGLEPEMYINAIERRVETFENKTDIDDITLEIVATEISRALSGTKVELIKGKYNLELSALILRAVTPASWKENIEVYGYKVEDINEYENKNPYYNPIDISKENNNYIPAEYSHPAERSSTGTTLCSKTARLNLSSLGVSISDIPRANAKDAKELYGFDGNNGVPAKLDYNYLLPNLPENINVLDLYVMSGSGFGHRAVAFQKEGNWFVLDPYKGNKTTKPMPMQNYTGKIESAFGHSVLKTA